MNKKYVKTTTLVFLLSLSPIILDGAQSQPMGGHLRPPALEDLLSTLPRSVPGVGDPGGPAHPPFCQAKYIGQFTDSSGFIWEVELRGLINGTGGPCPPMNVGNVQELRLERLNLMSYTGTIGKDHLLAHYALNNVKWGDYSVSNMDATLSSEELAKKGISIAKVRVNPTGDEFIWD